MPPSAPTRTPARPTPEDPGAGPVASRRAARAVLLLTLLAFVARAAFLLLEPRCELAGDEPSWIAFSTKILRHPEWLWPTRNGLVFYPPLYDYFVAVLRLVFGSLAAVKWAQVVLGTLLVPAVARAGTLAFGRTVGLAAATLTAVYPELLWYPAHFWSETLFLFLLWWAIERTLRADATGSLRQVAVAGLLWGLATLTRELSLYLVPFVALWLLRPSRGRWRPQPGAGRRVLGLLVSLVLTVAPWTVRNAVKFHAFIPVSTMGGLNLWQGNTTLTHLQIYDVLASVGGPVEQDRFSRRMALQAIRGRQPLWIVEKLEEQMPEFWKAGSEVLDHLGRGACGTLAPRTFVPLEVAFVGPYLIVYVFFVIGLARLRPGAPAWLLLILLGAYNLAHVVAYATTRFRLPVLPIVFLVASAGALGASEPPLAPLRGRRLLLLAVLAAVAVLVLAPGLEELETWHLLVGSR